MVAIPTTFGTGSESTHFATIYVDAMKFSLGAPSCLPKYYLLDEALGLSASHYIKASCGIDALCQAIESYWAKGANTSSQAYAVEAIALLVDHLSSFVNKEKNLVSAHHMAIASNLAGKAINISKTTAPHAISYAITQQYGIEHGQACFLSLPYFFYKNCQLDKTGQMDNLLSALKLSSPEEAIDMFYQLADQLHLKTRLDHIVDVEKNAVGTLAQQVNVERLGNHPCDVTQQDIIDSMLWSGPI